MNNGARCHCQCCTTRGLTGPAVVITIGVLFLLHQVHGGVFYFGNTWPVILLVIGLLHLASALAPREGHIERTPEVASLPGAPFPPVPPAGTPPSTFPSQGQ